jgi:hypothetical protein
MPLSTACGLRRVKVVGAVDGRPESREMRHYRLDVRRAGGRRSQISELVFPHHPFVAVEITFYLVLSLG